MPPSSEETGTTETWANDFGSSLAHSRFLEFFFVFFWGFFGGRKQWLLPGFVTTKGQQIVEGIQSYFETNWKTLSVQRGKTDEPDFRFERIAKGKDICVTLLVSELILQPTCLISI